MGDGGPRPWDAPRRRRDDRSFAVGVAALVGATVLLAVLGTALLMPPGESRHDGRATEPAKARPTRDPLARALMVAQATWYAPSPTPEPAATSRPTSTPVPVILCGVNATAGQACRWPEPPAPSPTPLPMCGTPEPGSLCRWGVAVLPTARPRP